jgi:hypothetical protein
MWFGEKVSLRSPDRDMKSLSVVKKPSATAAKRFAAALAVVLGGFALLHAFACASGNFECPVAGYLSSPLSWIGYVTDSGPETFVVIDSDLRSCIPDYGDTSDDRSKSTARQVF